MALTPEQEAAIIALISKTQKTISQLEAETALTGDKILPVENSDGTFALTVDDLKNYIVNNFPDASTTAKGIVELLTNAELAAGTDATRAATAAAIASLFGASLRSTNGYATLPVKVGGAFVEIIIQWGYVLAASIPTPGTNYTVNFPISFPSACLHVNYIGEGTYNGGSTANGVVISKSTPSFVLSHGFASPRDVMWFSLGY